LSRHQLVFCNDGPELLHALLFVSPDLLSLDLKLLDLSLDYRQGLRARHIVTVSGKSTRMPVI